MYTFKGHILMCCKCQAVITVHKLCLCLCTLQHTYSKLATGQCDCAPGYCHWWLPSVMLSFKTNKRWHAKLVWKRRLVLLSCLITPVLCFVGGKGGVLLNPVDITVFSPMSDMVTQPVLFIPDTQFAMHQRHVSLFSDLTQPPHRKKKKNVSYHVSAMFLFE